MTKAFRRVTRRPFNIDMDGFITHYEKCGTFKFWRSK